MVKNFLLKWFLSPGMLEASRSIRVLINKKKIILEPPSLSLEYLDDELHLLHKLRSWKEPEDIIGYR